MIFCSQNFFVDYQIRSHISNFIERKYEAQGREKTHLSSPSQQMAESRPESGSPDFCPSCCVQLSWFYLTQRSGKRRLKGTQGQDQVSLRERTTFSNWSAQRGTFFSQFFQRQREHFFPPISVCLSACQSMGAPFLNLHKGTFCVSSSPDSWVVPLSIRDWSKAARWNTEHLVIFDFQRDN